MMRICADPNQQHSEETSYDIVQIWFRNTEGNFVGFDGSTDTYFDKLFSKQ